MRIFVFITILLLLHIGATPQGFLKRSGKNIVNEKGAEFILRGMGLGGWMLQEPYMLQFSTIAYAQNNFKSKIKDLIGEEKTNRFYDAWLSNHCRKADIDSLASWGFNSVRLPMHYNLYTLPVEEESIAGQNTWLAKGFALTDSLLAWCKAARIYLILDLHAAPGGQGADAAISDRDTTKPSLWQSEAAQQKTIALWRKLADRYKNESWIGGYDLINETNWGFEKASDKNGCEEKINAPLKSLLQSITKAIRQVDTTHIIFIEANCWANNYDGIFPLWDSNMVVSFHKYWNNNDVASIKKFLLIREQQNVPVWMGESGENSNVWFRTAIQLLEENKIGWAWWPLKKLGNNNPLQIKKNKDYITLISYLEGKSPKPSIEKSFAALMQLAEDAKIDNNIFHKDVVDAMFRQTTSTATLPFKQNRIETNIYAVDYDLGRLGYAYYDNDTATYWVSTGKGSEWNKGRQYRNDGVDIDVCKDAITNGYAVTSMEKGEWLQYTITAKKQGRYEINLRAAAIDSTNEIGININNGNMNKLLIKPAKPSSWKTFIVNGIQLKEGKNFLKVKVVEGNINLNYFQFVPQKK